MDRPQVRAARAGDIAEMIRIQKESFAEAYGGFLDAGSLEAWLRGEIVEQYVREKWSQTLVAESLGEILGLVTLEGASVDLLWVRADRRSQGIGALLLGRAEARIVAGHAAVELECFAPNQRALRFYARHGYRGVRRYLDPLAGVEKVVLRKALG